MASGAAVTTSRVGSVRGSPRTNVGPVATASHPAGTSADQPCAGSWYGPAPGAEASPPPDPPHAADTARAAATATITVIARILMTPASRLPHARESVRARTGDAGWPRRRPGSQNGEGPGLPGPSVVLWCGGPA